MQALDASHAACSTSFRADHHSSMFQPWLPGAPRNSSTQWMWRAVRHVVYALEARGRAKHVLTGTSFRGASLAGDVKRTAWNGSFVKREHASRRSGEELLNWGSLRAMLTTYNSDSRDLHSDVRNEVGIASLGPSFLPNPTEHNALNVLELARKLQGGVGNCWRSNNLLRRGENRMI